MPPEPIHDGPSRDDSPARVVALARHAEHAFSKRRERSVRLVAGRGVEGDAHCGARVKHRSRVAADPDQPNLRQVHLIAGELLAELAELGFEVEPGALGENVTTTGVDLLALPSGTLLEIGREARLELTGLRNPCAQIERFRPGLLARVASRDEEGRLVRRAGVMAIVRAGGRIAEGDPIRVTLPDGPFRPLVVV